ncbi:MAG: hypothetical protein M0P17_07775 [Methanoculleus sp.]|nr:hypothetical protein [Methanoculleus sp.]
MVTARSFAAVFADGGRAHDRIRRASTIVRRSSSRRSSGSFACCPPVTLRGLLTESTEPTL